MLVLATGTIVADIIQPELPKIANPGEMLFTKRGAELHIGGHPNNIITDLVKLGVNPNDVGIIAALSSHPKDTFGEFLKFLLKKYGFKTFIQEVVEKTSSTNVIPVVKNEDRRFHLFPGANVCLRTDFVKMILKHEKPKVFCLRPGYTGIDNNVKEILKELKENSDTFVFLDVCRPYEKPWDYILPAMQYVDAIHGNKNELGKITGEGSFFSAGKKLLKMGVKMVFTTFGKEGAYLRTNYHGTFANGFEVKTIDPTGCGDAFCAGVIHKMIMENTYKDFHKLPLKKLKEVLKYAQAVGASAATVAGCTEGVSKKKVKKILEDKP